MKLNIKWKTILIVICILSLLSFVSTPLFWGLYTSLKIRSDIFKFALQPPSTLTFKNYIEIFQPPPGLNFGNYFVNGVILSPIVATLAVLMAVPAGYALSRIKFRGREFIKTFILVGYLTPPVLLIIPIYLLFNTIGLINTRQGLILALTAICIPGATWFSKVVFDGVPIELDESAIIDGASRSRIFFELTLPIVKPAIFCSWFVQFMTSWGDYLFSRLLIVSESLQLPSVAITNIYFTEAVEWGWFMACSIVISVPVIVLFLYVQKYFVAGWAAILRGAVR